MTDMEQLLGPVTLGLSIIIGLGLQRNLENGRTELRRWRRANPSAASWRDAATSRFERLIQQAIRRVHG